MTPRLALALAALSLVGGGARSQSLVLTEGATLSLTGGVQPRVGFAVEAADGTERVGLGLRRARLQFRLTLLGRLGMEYDIDATPGDLRSVDLFAFYDVSEAVQLRAGRLPPAQARGYTLTSFSRIDAVDRAAVDERWAAGTLGASGRDIAVDLAARVGATELQVSVHNGTGGFSRDTDNFRESGSSPSVTRGADDVALALSASAHRGGPTGLSFGGFASANARGNEQTALGGEERAYVTGGLHVYWGERPGAQPVRVKLDALGTAYQDAGGVRQRSAGVGLLGAVRVLGHGEAFARAERYWDEVDGRGDTFGTVGASYSPSAAVGRDYRDVRVTAAYVVRRNANGALGHLGVVQGQIVF